MELALAVVLGLWLLLSVLAQFPALRIMQFDRLELLPNCRFFTPQPISTDVQVFVQTFRFGETSARPWAPIFAGDRRWYAFVWCPAHRLNKTIGDLLDSLLAGSSSDPWKRISAPYLVLLAAARGVVRPDPDHTHLRFMIAESRGFDDPSLHIAFVSHAHRL